MERKPLVRKVGKNKLLKFSDQEFKELIIQAVTQRGTIAAMARCYGANREWLSRQIIRLFGIPYRELLKGKIEEIRDDVEEFFEYVNPRGDDYPQLIAETRKVDPEHAAWMARVVQDIKARDSRILRVRSSA